MVTFENKPKYNVYDLERLIKILRAPGGCPWDAEQTHESIRRNFLEETYEVCEAIDEKNSEHLCEELGDVLTQVVFHAGIESDAGRFDLDDVADMVVRKLVYRHPHVFGTAEVSGTDEVLTNWDALKQTEKKQETAADTLKAVAKSLPSLWRAEKLQKKAAKVGFDWNDADGPMDKLADELTELSDAMNEGTNTFEELGDVLFSAVNVARHLGIDPEEALHASCDKFTARFERLENAAAAEGKKLAELSAEEMDRLYEEIKHE
ncbi:MAG: nucleoside triphosphate pyrophosphohydrolase [Oscillospiraceae bacterium]|nr:nucleoside triphosphate pyrophosphohydrolase [Oscillospiraceae bacterium]